MTENPGRRTRRPLLLIFIPLAAFLWNRSFLEEGLPLAGDNPSHLAEIRALEDVILPEQSWWCGWFEGDFFGYPLLAYQYPLGKSTVALLDFLLP
ncbi:MAG TPA: hypothetical protein P5057_09210, partial [Acidobacteriota bacterium]|nr:hypothetical protein [Acidobacteriota bacterium]